MSIPGLDRARVLHGLRLALAALMALAIATWMGLPNPYWAPMTVWITAQPTRGMLAERLLFRLLGTTLGALAGAALLQVTHAPAAVVALLALWVGLCAAAGNLLRHSLAYGTLLAGYTAGVVVLPDFVPFLPHQDLASTRVVATLVGVVVSAAMTWLLTPEAPRTALLREVEALGRAGLEWAGHCLGPGHAPDSLRAVEHRLLAEMARIEELGDQTAAGSPRAYSRIRAVRGLMAALLSLISSVRLAQGWMAASPSQGAWGEAWGHYLAALAADPRHALPPPPAPPGMERAAALLNGAVAELRTALNTLHVFPGTPPRPMPFHRDWRGATASGLRATLAVGGLGTVWLLSGWAFGPFLVMGGSIFASVFSTHPQPTWILRHVLAGACVGVVLALAYRLLLLPTEASLVRQLLTCTPFMVVGGLALAQPRLAKAALDANMVFLLASQAGMPLHLSPSTLVEGGLAIPLSIAAALLAFRWVLPVNEARRLSQLASALRHDIAGLAGAPDGRALLRGRARLDHRLLRLAWQQPDRLGEALAVLRLGDALRLLRSEPRPALEPALQALRVPRAPFGAVQAMLREAASQMQPDAAVLAHEAASALGEAEALFAVGHAASPRFRVPAREGAAPWPER